MLRSSSFRTRRPRQQQPRSRFPQQHLKMSPEFLELAVKLDGLREKELELQASEMEPGQLEVARSEMREQLRQVEEDIAVLEERERQPAEQGAVETSVTLTPLQQSLQRVYGSSFAELSMPELHQHLRMPYPPESDQSTRESLASLSVVSVRNTTPTSLPTPSVPNSGNQNTTRTASPAETSSDNQQRRSRVYLTDEDKLSLMSLCVDYQAEHVRQKKTEFWTMIAEMFQQTNGVVLKQPQKTVRGLVAQRKATLRVQERESGTVQREDELTQKIDEWLRHEQAVEEAAAQAAKTPAAEEREREEAVVQRRYLLARRGMKRGRGPSDEGSVDGEEGEDGEGNSSTSNIGVVGVSTQKRRKRDNDMGEEFPVVDMRAAMADMGKELSTGLLTAVRELVTARLAPGQSGIDEKFQELREEIGRDREALERHRDLMEIRRAEDLARAEKQRIEDLSSHRELIEKQRAEDRLRMEKERAEDKAAHEARNDDLLARLFGKLEELQK